MPLPTPNIDDTVYHCNNGCHWQWINSPKCQWAVHIQVFSPLALFRQKFRIITLTYSRSYKFCKQISTVKYTKRIVHSFVLAAHYVPFLSTAHRSFQYGQHWYSGNRKRCSRTQVIEGLPQCSLSCQCTVTGTSKTQQRIVTYLPCMFR